jgi:hypothetical protein
MRLRLAFVATALAAATGCVTTIRPPAAPADPVAVRLIDYGYHASLVLPAGEGASVEFAYGEWEWFALNNDAWYRVFPALLWPTQGALGRRRFDVPPDAVAVPAEEVLRFRVGRAEAAAPRRRLEERFASRPEEPVHNPLVGLTFVPDATSYCAAVNCNTVLAGWLRELGCEVSPPACTASFLLKGDPRDPVPR